MGGRAGSLSAAGGPDTESRCQCQEDLIFISRAGHVPPDSEMTTKIIHFMVNGKLEQAEFRADCSAAEVKGKREGPLACYCRFERDKAH